MASKLAHCSSQATGSSNYLLLGEERAPEHADALRDHADLKLVLALEPVDDLLERRVVLELEAVPERPLRVAVLVLLRRDGLREAEERQCEVDEAVLVVLELVLAVDELRRHISLLITYSGYPAEGKPCKAPSRPGQ